MKKVHQPKMVLKFVLSLALVSFVLAQHGEKCDRKKENFLPHPTNCSKFYSCGGRFYVEMECPAMLHFNPDEKFCDWPAEAGCTIATNGHQVLPSSETLMDNFDIVPGKRCVPSQIRNAPRIAPYTENCAKFLICTKTWKVMDCPRGLFFSVETGHCEYPDDVKCCQDCIDPLKSCPINGALRTNPFDCHRFYICNNGTLVDLVCSEGNIFSAIKGKCVSGSTCNETVPVQSSENLPNCSVDEALYPSYQNCSKFFMCNGGTIVEQSCSPNKFFSVSHGNCQLKAFAVCAGDLQSL